MGASMIRGARRLDPRQWLRGDEAARHRALSEAAAAALSLVVVGMAISFVIEAITHPASTAQLMLASALLLMLQAGALGVMLARAIVLRVLAGAAAVGAQWLLSTIGFTDFWIAGVATIALLGLRGSGARWVRLLAVLGALFAGSAFALWAQALPTTPLIRLPIVVTSIVGFFVILLLVVNFIVGRDAWGSILVVSGASLGVGRMLGFGGMMVETSQAGEGSLTAVVNMLSLVGTRPLDMVMSAIVPIGLVVWGIVRIFRSAEAPLTGVWRATGLVNILALVLAAATLAPAAIGLVSDEVGLLSGVAIDFVYPILWFAALFVWRSSNRTAVTVGHPATALAPSHAMAVGIIALSPLVQGTLSWLSIMISGENIYA